MSALSRVGWYRGCAQRLVDAFGTFRRRVLVLGVVHGDILALVGVQLGHRLTQRG